MHKFILIFIIIFLSSCATTRYGNFAKYELQPNNRVVQDVVRQLKESYPPAHHVFCIDQKTNDTFGQQLIKQMRQTGYGLIEHGCSKQAANFYYLIDRIKPQHIYRISLFINDEVISRLYQITNHQFTPISAWSHQEKAE